MPLLPEKYNPFTPYTPRRYCPSLDNFVEENHCGQEIWVAPERYEPQVRVTRRGSTICGHLEGSDLRTLSYILLDQDDFDSWRGKINEINVVRHFQGRIGERVLTLYLEGLIQRLVGEAKRSGSSRTTGKVLRERRKIGRVARRHIVEWDDEYILQFDRKTTFVLRMKSREGEPLIYIPGRGHFQRSEFDGLAYLCVEPGGEKYMVIAEVKTTKNFRLDKESWGSHGNIEERLFTPLKTLFPDFNLVYLIMGNPQTLSSKESGLRPRWTRILEKIKNIGILPLIMPLPPGVDCTTLAQEGYEALHKRGKN